MSLLMARFGRADPSHEGRLCATGRIVREVKAASGPEALLQVLRDRIYLFKRIGLEAGPLSQWFYSALAPTII